MEVPERRPRLRTLLRFGWGLAEGGAFFLDDPGWRHRAGQGAGLCHVAPDQGGQVVPAEWLRASWTVDPDIRDAFDRSVSGPFLPGGWYRNQFWFLPRDHGDVLLCLGIHGQMLYVSPGTGTAAAKLSTWPDAQSPAMLHDTLRAFDAIGATLAGLAVEDATRRHGPPGVAAGLSRGGVAGGPQ